MKKWLIVIGLLVSIVGAACAEKLKVGLSYPFKVVGDIYYINDNKFGDITYTFDVNEHHRFHFTWTQVNQGLNTDINPFVAEDEYNGVVDIPTESFFEIKETTKDSNTFTAKGHSFLQIDEDVYEYTEFVVVYTANGEFVGVSGLTTLYSKYGCEKYRDTVDAQLNGWLINYIIKETPTNEMTKSGFKRNLI